MLYIICQRQQGSWNAFHRNSPLWKMQNLCPSQPLTGGPNNAGKIKLLPCRMPSFSIMGRLGTGNQQYTCQAFQMLDLKVWCDDILGPGAIIKNHSNEPTCSYNALQRGQSSQQLPLTCPIVLMQISSAKGQWESGFLLQQDLHTLDLFL